MKKRLNVMNWLKKYSKLCLLLVIPMLLQSSISFAETLTGGIRKELSLNQKRHIDLPEVQPKYSNGAIFAYNKGIEEYKLTNYDKAIDSFKFAIEQEPKFSDAYFNLGILYDYFDNTSEAAIAFNRAYITNKKDYEALYYMIKCFVEMGDTGVAKSYIKKIPSESEFFQKANNLIK